MSSIVYYLPDIIRANREQAVAWRYLRSCCEEYWNFINTGQERKTNKRLNPLISGPIKQWRTTLKEIYGREMPIIVGAAAMLQREFIGLTITSLPQTDPYLPDNGDSIDRTIAVSSNWKSALQIALKNINETKDVIDQFRPEWGITADTHLPLILNLLHEEYERRILQLERIRPKLRRPSVQPLVESGCLLIPADRINKATIESLTYGAMTVLRQDRLHSLGISTTFWRGHTFGASVTSSGRDQVVGAIGFKHEPEERVWRFLQRNGALAIKAQYALWARAYAETNAAPGVFISLTISQFCDDIGMVRKKGAHRAQSKQAAIAVLELLTEMELVCIYQPPNGPAQRIRGPIWSRGIISEELRGYEDVFKGTALSERPSWIPKAFSYAPGPFFENETWRAYNRYIALVGEGLLKLNASNADKYAVMVGGYLAILARMNGYRKCVVGVRTLLEKTGLWAVDRDKNPGRMRRKLEDALDRLCEVEVIKKWEITSSKENIDPDDLNDAYTLENLGEPTRWTEGWLAQSVIVDWPGKIKKRESILKKKKESHMKKAMRRRRSNIPPLKEQ
jgi:hypothetical protein